MAAAGARQRREGLGPAGADRLRARCDRLRATDGLCRPLRGAASTGPPWPRRVRRDRRLAARERGRVAWVVWSEGVGRGWCGGHSSLARPRGAHAPAWASWRPCSRARHVSPPGQTPPTVCIRSRPALDLGPPGPRPRQTYDRPGQRQRPGRPARRVADRCPRRWARVVRRAGVRVGGLGTAPALRHGGTRHAAGWPNDKAA